MKTLTTKRGRRAEKRLFRNEHGQVYGEFVLKPFSIAKSPVTYQQFRAFHESPDGFNNEQWWEGLTEKYRQQEILVSGSRVRTLAKHEIRRRDAQHRNPAAAGMGMAVGGAGM